MKLLSLYFVLQCLCHLSSLSAFLPTQTYKSIGVFPRQYLNCHNSRDLRSPKHTKTLPLLASLPNSSEGEVLSDSVIRRASLSLKRTSWFSWWGQVILTTVSAVTLVFARGILNVSTETNRALSRGGLVFAGSGITLSILSIFWTWGGARLSRRLLLNKNRKTSQPYTRIKVASMLRRTISIGSYINIFGMLTTLIGAEQIIGLLAAKALTIQGASPFGLNGVNSAAVAVQTLQPLDIFIVQANTNTLLSHFVSLVCCLFLTRSVRRLDPPSVDEDSSRKNQAKDI